MSTEIKKYLDTTALGTLVEQIKAEDAKVLDAAKKYADDAGKSYDAAGSAATAESNAKAYTDELANGQVKTNKEDIAKLNGDATTEGSVAKAVADAKALIDADVEVVEGKADKNATDIAAINNETTGILVTAKGYADGKAAEVQGNVDTLAQTVADLDAYVGDIPSDAEVTNIIAYINKKAQETLDAASGNTSESAESVMEALNTYKAENDPKVTKNTEDIGALQTALDEEIGRASGIEAGLETRLAAVEEDYLTSADKDELQDNIDAVSGAIERLTNGVSAEEIDGVNDLIQYVKDHGTEVTGMQEDISDNAEAIAGVAGRMDTAEGKITNLETSSALHAEKTYVDEQVQALQNADTGLGNRIAAIEAKFGEEEGSVEDLIADAKQEAIDAAASDATAKANKALEDAKKYADEEDAKIESRVGDLEAASATHALASDVTTLEGRVTVNEGAISTLNTNLDGAVARIGANETAIGTINTELAKKALASDLTALDGRVATNEGAIATLNGAVATKAEQEDLNGALDRLDEAEAAIAANASAIGAFAPITSAEVVALFA